MAAGLPPEPDRRPASRALAAWMLSGAVPGLVALVVAAVAFHGTARVIAVLAALAFAAVVAVGLPLLRYRTWRYAVREDEIDLRHGIVIETRTLVPMVRVQHVDTRRTPVSRYFGLAAVAFHTAAGATEIPALREADAAAIRDRIADLALQPEVL
jgi:uncharacterized protein